MPGKALTTAEFIKRAKKVHGDKYDYSNTTYTGAKNNVEIKCNTHNSIFIQIAGNHIQGRGCSDCTKGKNYEVWDNKTFIQKAKSVHGDKYDYSRVEYINSYTHVEIICPIHGSFNQIAGGHYQGHGCLKCGNENRKLSLKEFIQKAESVHGEGKYDYSQVIYINNSTHIEIGCPRHGIFFEQTPGHHLDGNGCEKCARDNSRLTMDEFIQRAQSVHGDKYDYSKVAYLDHMTKVEILCQKHGSYWQTPNHHLCLGNGCHKCNESKGEKMVSAVLDKLRIPYEKQKKFPTCRNINCLPFDFYLESYNLCIEYDGQQHFEPVKHFGGEERFKTQQEIDTIKNEWCENNNVNLLRIDYRIKDIEPLITQMLAGISGNSSNSTQ